MGSFLVLAAMRYVIGTAIFGALVWVYFIDHFLKAEKFFASPKVVPEPILKRWLNSYQPDPHFRVAYGRKPDMGETCSTAGSCGECRRRLRYWILATGG
ncbi:MAG: hypothetical protein R2688_02585 [Fimbriimonadaceae bacterium]